LKNLREAIERLFERQSGTIKEALTAAEAASGPAVALPVTTMAPEAMPAPEPSHPQPRGDLAPASPRQ
jgi:hypothetical protein